MLNMARMELRQGLSLILGSKGDCVGRSDIPMCVLAWACLDALCRPFHGPTEKLVNEVRERDEVRE